MKIKIVIIGLGSLGKRHLQAVGRLEFCEKIIGYDINPAALESIAPFCQANEIVLPSNVELTLDEDRVLSQINSDTVVIIATTALGREEIFKKVIPRSPRAIIAEKPVCQGPDQYETVLALASEFNVKVYVDFLRHLVPVYQELYSQIRTARVKNFSAISWGGFASSGIHVIELMTWLFQAQRYSLIHSSYDSIFETKRKGFFDFSGQLTFLINDQHLCSVVITKDPGYELFQILTDQAFYQISELNKKIVIADSSTELKILDIETQSLYISQTTEMFLRKLINNKVGMFPLPSLEQSYLAHKMLFEFMDHFQLSKVNIT